MNKIRSKWIPLTLLTLVITYVLFIFIMDKRTDLLYMAAYIYIVITLLVFSGTIIGIPGLILHGFFKNETIAYPFYAVAILLGTNNTNILTAYGLIQLKRYAPEKALKVFEKAKATSKHFFYQKALGTNIALCHWKLGDIAKATEMYENVFYFPDLERITDFSLDNLSEGEDKNGNFFVQDFITLAYMYFLQQDYEKATYFTQVGLKKSEKYGPGYDNLGQIHYALKDFNAAKDYFKEGLKYKPGMTDSIYYLSLIELEAGNREEALQYFNSIHVNKINGLSTITINDIETLKNKLGL